jgi:glycerophosphoryl diester phosphodiesterase
MNAIAPENTLHAARLCFDQGFQVVELDVRRAADGALAVIHDATLDRTTDGAGPVAARSMAELGRLSAGIRFNAFFRNERIMPLSAFLETAGTEGQLYVEIKDADPARTLAEVERAGILSRIFFWSADATLLFALRGLSGRARIMVERDSFATIRDAIEVLRPAIVQFHSAQDDLGEIDRCRRARVTAMVKYFGADPAVFEHIIRLKPDMINVDRADIFLAAYAKVTGIPSRSKEVISGR